MEYDQKSRLSQTCWIFPTTGIIIYWAFNLPQHLPREATTIMEHTSTIEQFVRTRYTWLAYFMLAYFAYLMASLGPLMPFLSTELGLSYSEAGAHFSAFAAGMVISGFIGDHIVKRSSRRFTFWFGGTGMAAGTVMLILGQQAGVTIAASLVMGLLGTLLLQTIQATLSDLHGHRRAIALSESNIAASLLASLAPILIGEFQRTGFSWRAALTMIIFAYAFIGISTRNAYIPETLVTISTDIGTKRGLPRSFWLLWIVVFFCVATEWSVGYWGAEYLHTAAGLSQADASTSMTAFFGAVVIGRLIGSHLVRGVATEQVLRGSALLATLGFTFFWFESAIIINIASLFLIGLGIANLFPLTLALAIATASENINKASARISLASGSAILIVPQTLGIVADQTGIRSAYLIAFILLLAATAMIFLNRFDRK